MDDPGKKGVLSTLAPIEGPATRMGRRGSFRTVETSSVNIPGVGFGSNDSRQASLDFGVKAFEFVKSVASETAVRKISDGPKADESMDPMKYKRTKARRVSLIGSDGLKMDFLAAGGRDDKKTSPLVLVDQVRTANPDEGRSLTRMVETNRIGAASGFGLGVPFATPGDDPKTRPEADEGRDRSVPDRILNHWFFKNPNAQEAAKPSVEGIGHGQLTSKVVSALSLQPDPKESRKMNMWMPQGM